MKLAFTIEVFLAMIATASAAAIYDGFGDGSYTGTGETQNTGACPEGACPDSLPEFGESFIPPTPPPGDPELKAFVCGDRSINGGEPTSVRYWTGSKVRICVDLENAYAAFYQVKNIASFQCANGNVEKSMLGGDTDLLFTEATGSKDVDSINTLGLSGMAIESIITSDLTGSANYVTCTGVAYVQKIESYYGERTRALQNSEEALDGDRDDSSNSNERKLSQPLVQYPFETVIPLEIRATMILYLSEKKEPNILPGDDVGFLPPDATDATPESDVFP